MTRDLVAVAPDTGLGTIARILTENRISGVPVVDSEGRAVGVVSVTDLIDPDRQTDSGPGFPVFYRIEDGWATPEIGQSAVKDGRAEDVMTPLPFTVTEDATLADAARTMVEHRVHRLLVTRDGVLSGIVSTLDLLRGYSSE